MLSIGQMKANAKSQLNGKLLVTAAVFFLGALIMSAVSFTFIGTLLLYGVIQFGYSCYLLGITRNRNNGFSSMFSGFDRFGDTCVTGILHMIYTILWTFLFIIPGIVKSYSYSMTYFIMQDDPTKTGNAAITESRNMMNGRKMKLFLLDLSFLGWYILSIFTFGLLAIIYVIPYHNAARANFYEEARREFYGITE